MTGRPSRMYCQRGVSNAPGLPAPFDGSSSSRTWRGCPREPARQTGVAGVAGVAGVTGVTDVTRACRGAQCHCNHATLARKLIRARAWGTQPLLHFRWRESQSQSIEGHKPAAKSGKSCRARAKPWGCEDAGATARELPRAQKRDRRCRRPSASHCPCVACLSHVTYLTHVPYLTHVTHITHATHATHVTRVTCGTYVGPREPLIARRRCDIDVGGVHLHGVRARCVGEWGRIWVSIWGVRGGACAIRYLPSLISEIPACCSPAPP